MTVFGCKIQRFGIGLLVVLLYAGTASGADWDAVQLIERDHKVGIVTGDGAVVHGAFRSATADEIQLLEKTGERSIERRRIRRVGVHDPSRRVKRGVLFMLLGAGVGAGVGGSLPVLSERRQHLPVRCARRGSGSGPRGAGFSLLALPDRVQEQIGPAAYGRVEVGLRAGGWTMLIPNQCHLRGLFPVPISSF
jgi:hypothetical protein